MTADADKVPQWRDCDVYVAPSGTAAPATVNTAFSASWDHVGYLDGEEGSKVTREWGEKNEHYAWGGDIVKTSRGKFKLTRTFTAIEDNETTRELLWPGSLPGGEHYAPVPVRQMIAFEFREGATVRREIYADVEIEASEWTDSETDITKVEFEVTAFPEADGTYYREQSTELPGS